jgi:hypothetical protein
VITSNKKTIMKLKSQSTQYEKMKLKKRKTQLKKDPKKPKPT